MMKNWSRRAGCGLTARFALILFSLLGLIMLGYSAWLAFRYSGQALLGTNSFRQAQTALTAYWVCQDGFHLRYATPVGGYPWSIPFEFPIYQYLVALISCPLHLELDRVGRIVSYVFWIACLVPSSLIARRLFSKHWRLHFVTFALMFLATPLYLSESRSFMMETTALFFTLFFIAFSLEMSRGVDNWQNALLTGTFLTLAILQKSTTVLPLLPIFGALYLAKVLPSLRLQKLGGKSFWRGIIAYVVPFLIGYVWVKYTDHVKMANALGRMLTSHALMTWNFGTLNGRLSSSLWIDVIWHRVIGLNVAGHLGIFAILLGIFYAKQFRLLICSGACLFLLFFMVFENLLYVHVYYPQSALIYLVFALSLSISGLIEERPQLSTIWVVLGLVIIAVNLTGFFKGPTFDEERTKYDDTNPVLESAKYVREHTSPTEPIAIYGDDWNSELPYYTQRRSFAIPPWVHPYTGPIDDPDQYLGGAPGAIMVCGNERNDAAIIDDVATHFGTWRKAQLSLCDVYSPR